MRRRKLLLVNPVNSARAGFTSSRVSRFPPIGLGMLAAATPPEWDVELADENFQPVEQREADLVAVTAFTSAANRAYEIAAGYRALGVPVVMGGIHASMRTDEALECVDAVVAGEGETVWPQVLDDFTHNRLQPHYVGRNSGEVRPSPIRRDLFDPRYMFATLQTSRGCPLDCDFCSVTAFNGRRYRRRDIPQVLDELERIDKDLLFFVDDNLIGYKQESREQALELFRGMVDRGIDKHWFCQASINVADDPELLEWAYQAGCRMIFVGIESEDEEGLAEVNKRLNLKRGVNAYEELFGRIHAAGIAVLGAFIFGMDSDTPEKLQRRAEFMIHSGVDVMQATVCTPLPGTRLFERMLADGRLRYTNFPDDWQRYNFTEVVFHPRQMAAEELSATMRDCVRRMYDMKTLKAKAKRTHAATGSWEATEFAFSANMSYREIGISDTAFPEAA